VAISTNPASNLPYVRHCFAPREQFDHGRSLGDQRDVKIKRITQHGPSLRPRVASWWLAAAVAIIAMTSVAAETALSLQDSITVEGNRRVEADTIRSYFHAAPDGRFDEAARDAALKLLVATGLFEKVSIERAGERLVVHVTEAPVLDRVTFEGNRKVKDADLAAALESKPRGSLQRAAVQADVGRIIEAYRHVGRDDVHVAPEIIDRDNGRAD
jgi:outer membrane protein insertion porin family